MSRAKRIKKSPLTLEDLPNEVLWKICDKLNTIDLIICGQISKRIRVISQDVSLRRKKISLENMKLNFKIINRVILPNSKLLTVLNLRACNELNMGSIYDIVNQCVELAEFNLESTNLCPDSLNFFATNLTPKVKKLSLRNVKNLKDKHVISLSKRCNRMISLDLSRTLITDVSLSSVILNLKSSLEEIDIEETKISVDKLLVLRSIPTLIVLNHSFEDLEGQFSGFIRKNIEIAT